jgi:PD-(D/E)XK nuclease superfamily
MPVSLYLAGSFDGAWEQVVLPWFQAVAPRAFQEAFPVGVLTPFPGHAHLVRSRLLSRGFSLLGVNFLSPAQLREILLRGSGLNLPLREHLRLLLATAAEEIATGKAGSLVAESVGRDPDQFLRLFDQLNASGWGIDELGEPALREIAARFVEISRGCGFTFVHDADRVAATNVTNAAPHFAHLLVTGFDGAHWPLWPLLRAAVKSSARATIVLNDPRDEARDLDETWVGTWEEAFGEAEPISTLDKRQRSSLPVKIPETKSDRIARAENPSDNIYFLVGRELTAQARAVVALTAKFLVEENCERIGVLFPQAGALPRLVSMFLESARIAHNDRIAHLAPSAFENEAWRTWLELQQNPRLKFLFRFLHAAGEEIFAGVSIADAEGILRRAYADLLIDDLDILREHCTHSKDKASIARGLQQIQFFPATATLPEFLAQTRKIFTQLGWKQHWNEIERLSRNWSERLTQPCSKRSYLRWLREVLGNPSLVRDDCGAHPYSRVHLLPYSEAEGQPWSHLIFAGLNEEAWPSLDDESAFVADQDIDEFNRRSKTLNRRAVRRGSQGEGQRSMGEGKTLLLGTAERRQIRQRQLRNLTEAASAAIGVTANLYSESSRSRIANPTEFFSGLYFATRGRGVSHKTLEALEQQTCAWLKDWSPVDAQKIDSVNVARTGYAYHARRQRRAAGEYEFALRAPPDHPVTLRVTDWEQAMKWPALVWMKVFLGVEPDEENGDAWAMATGQWVHRWLAESVRDGNTSGLVEIPDVNEIRTRILRNAREFQSQIRELCAACARPLPDWWLSGWSNALSVADHLAVKLSGLAADWSYLAPEFSLESPTLIPVDDDEVLRVRGRIDLMLARGEANQSRIGFPEAWVIDYKTGKQRGFNLRDLKRNESTGEKLRRQLAKGSGVQLGLYALAAHSLGASEVGLTLLGLADELEPQFHLRDALAQKDFWRELSRMQETGVFGMLREVYSEYGPSRTYPLATLGIDPNLLEEKWAIAHPALAVGSEGSA